MAQSSAHVPHAWQHMLVPVSPGFAPQSLPFRGQIVLKGIPSFFLSGQPDAGELIGVHEGPRAKALSFAQEPFGSALVPEPGVAGSGVMTYSFGAAFFSMLEGFWEATSPGSFQVGPAAASHAALMPVNQS